MPGANVFRRIVFRNPGALQELIVTDGRRIVVFKLHDVARLTTAGPCPYTFVDCVYASVIGTRICLLFRNRKIFPLSVSFLATNLMGMCWCSF